MEGKSISASAPMGTCVRSSTLAAHSGRTRSKAAAKIMRVELRKTLPAHPKNHSERSSRSTTWIEPVREEHRGEHARVREPVRRRREGCPVLRAQDAVEAEAHGVCHRGERDQDDDRGEQQRAAHGVDVLSEVAGTADLAVEGRAPVGPQVEEEHEGDQEERRSERRRAVALERQIGLVGRADRALVGVRGVCPVDVRLAVERGDEVRLRVQEEDGDHEHQPDHRAVEAPLLEPGVPAHARRDHHGRDHRGEDRRDEDPGAVDRVPPRGVERARCRCSRGRSGSAG